ncbi:hypothetical protein DFH29DRAFT_1069590 [Suillus ampliporus]|nr:hypothetical protein DFH29DRAFT_1069590 [Suillus ampliporus]
MKKRLSHLVGRGRSNPHLPVESGANDIESSSCPPSRNGSRTRLPGLVPKFIDKVTNRSARSAGQSPNPGPAAASSSAQDLLPAQTSQDPSPLTAPTPETTPDQASNSAISKADPPPDPELVKATLTDAKAGFEGITNVSGMVQNIVSASDNLQSVPDTMDTFSAILGPLKVFNDVANGLADVRASISIFSIHMQRWH